MISHKHKVMYIHIPKCAGESIETVFLGGPYNIVGHKYNGELDKHWGVKEYKKYCPKEFESYFKFAIVRNPWERMVSWSKYRDKQFNRKNDGTFLERFENDLQPKHQEYLRQNSCCNMLFIDDHLSVDYVIRFENLQDDFDALCDILKTKRRKLPKLNVGKYQHYSVYYTEKTKKLVEEIYKDDIEFFGFTFEKKM